MRSYYQLELLPGICPGEVPVPPELVSLAAYVAEDGLVGHHCEERPLGIANLYNHSGNQSGGSSENWT